MNWDITTNGNGNVILVEPNSVNTEGNNNTNAIPQYQDMYIFAELTAKSRGRTIIINDDVKSESSKSINFIGNDQNADNNPNHLKFTTNYYDGSNDGKTYYEGFGMNSIKIVTNSSFIPQVNIQFIDVRGLAFFNQADSPYRILFDFPPPIFTLTVKGYYGKPLTYKLHLVKYTSEFSADNGNFIIDAQFVAMTFAPLTDILFRYVVNAPLINNEKSMTPTPGTKPKTTFELILKLKNLYANVANKLDSDEENQKYKNVLLDLEKIDSINEILAGFKENETLLPAGTPYLAVLTPRVLSPQYEYSSVPEYDMAIDDNLIKYNNIIKYQGTTGVDTYFTNRLYLLFYAATGIKTQNNIEPIINVPQTSAWAYNSENISNFDIPLSEFKKRLLAIKLSSLKTVDSDIGDPVPFLNPYNVQTNTVVNDPNSLISTNGYTKYYAIDITRFYNKLYHAKAQLEKDRDNLSVEIAKKINAMVAEDLGMKPSIYNIFEIILNDVDIFFNKVKTTSDNALMLHNQSPDKGIILNDSSYTEKKTDTTPIFSFPLVIKTLDNRQERVAPLELNRKVKFPEIDLVTDFMDTFLIQKRYAKLIDWKNNAGEGGVNNWIPISPYDSSLSGLAPQSPYIGISDDVINDTLRIVLKRFYMLTQGILPSAFYYKSTGNKNDSKIIKSGAYSKLYGTSEAINLAAALTRPDNIKAINIMATKYKGNIDNFYTYIKTLSDDETGSLYSFSKENPEYFLISESDTVNGRVYVDKNNPNFTGVKLTPNTLVLQEPNPNSSKPIDNFNNDAKEKKWFKDDSADSYYGFSNENLIYLKDIQVDVKSYAEKVTNEIDGVKTFTRYLAQVPYYTPTTTVSIIGESLTQYENRNKYFPGEGNNDVERQEIAYNNGNLSFEGKDDEKGFKLNFGDDIIDVWSEELGENDDIVNDITNGSLMLSSILILSNLGHTCGPFNRYSNALNSVVFDAPAAIEVPTYFAPYIGALLTALDDDNVTEIIDYFTTGHGKTLANRGFYVLADLHDVNLYLSENDKRTFKLAYDSYIRSASYTTTLTRIKELYDTVMIPVNDISITNTQKYDYYLDKNAEPNHTLNTNGADRAGEYWDVLSGLIKRETLLNYTELTFKLSNTYNTTYASLDELNKSSAVISGTNNTYFTTFFTELSTLTNKVNDDVKKEQEELTKMKGDTDIINQLYYSFKNINDKWISGSKEKYYPFNYGRGSLIDSFAFVDRGMNPIGETILNGEILIDMLDDPNISLFTVLSQLLSLNGFEFFPLQNFMSFKTEDSWKDSFRIHTGGYDDTQNPFFVCMYIGGSSSYPSVSDNGFEDDGITDISVPGVKDFSTTKLKDSEIDELKTMNEDALDENEKQIINNKFPWQEVRAFRVRFGEQNQSMFTDIKIDSKEYPETNESIQILSRLAGDGNPDAPVPIGQSLYNLYENRSYKATVTGLGNAMIQPTQYFQLENIPMFNGAYIILDVEHNITPNKMTTTFSGTKLLKYPMPRILTPLAFASFDGLSGADAITAAEALIDRLAERMTPGRLDYLKGSLGVDVSKANGFPDWARAKKDGVDYAMVKITEGMNYYDGSQYNMAGSVANAINNGVNVTFYHFARFDRGTDPIVDGIDDAENCIKNLEKYSKPKLPIALDIEELSFGKTLQHSNCKWTGKLNENIPKFTKAFIDTMSSAGYKTMLYARKNHIEEYGLSGFNKQPLWIARWFVANNISQNAENTEPPVPTEWRNGWNIWQFSANGKVDGFNGDVDINVVKNSFIKS